MKLGLTCAWYGATTLSNSKLNITYWRLVCASDNTFHMSSTIFFLIKPNCLLKQKDLLLISCSSCAFLPGMLIALRLDPVA